MYLQGNLQNVFDALYTMGVIDPVLEMDWDKALEEIPSHFDDYQNIIKVANCNYSNINSLVEELQGFSEKAITFLAIEVAREFADFHTRAEIH